MKNKSRKILSTITNFIFSVVFVAITIGTIYFIDVIRRTPSLDIELISKKKASKIYDNNDNFIKQLNVTRYNYGVSEYQGVNAEQIAEIESLAC